MVGTTRFELATSPTPRVRSTRLSHVPTVLHPSAQGGRQRGYAASISVHERRPARSPITIPRLVSRSNILLRQRSALAEKELIHLFHQKILRLARPRL
jgi:hypothetical protein